MAGFPLPPYITRDPTERDEDRYQTVYARAEGSVAAPTAGLHSPRDPGFAVRERGAHRRTGPPGVGPAPSSRWKWTTPASTRCTPSATRSPAARRDGRSGAGAGRQHLGRRYDGRAGTRERGGRARDGSRRRRRDQPDDHARLFLPRGGPPAHQLPPAPLDAAHAGERVRRPRADPRGIRARRDAALSVLFVW